MRNVGGDVVFLIRVVMDDLAMATLKGEVK